MGNEDDGISAERRSAFCPADRVHLKDAREDTWKMVVAVRSALLGSDFLTRKMVLNSSVSEWVVFWPQSIPYQSLGPLGLFTQYLVDHHHTFLHNGYWLAWLIHVGESLYAMVLCKSKGITDGRAQLLWFLQTFLFGIASLSILIAYRPKRQKQT
ncbi:transmembrane protein 254 isoform X1 [Neovison vison]|uniref:transmembrane protein 254 isoform X1 n=1 Tax=Neovison vison TaxID=452646 RepID=UPI001CF0595D|nr:transmembrane protein 254 isoform X1 [Neogale vison]